MGIYRRIIAVFVMLALVSIVESNPAKEDRYPQELASPPSVGCKGFDELMCGGRVFYINPTHHSGSLSSSNIARIMRNAVRFVSPNTSGPISVLIFANAVDRAQAIFDSISGQPDIDPVMTIDQNDLLSLSSYDAVIIQSNGFDFDTSVEQSVLDFQKSGGGVIGGHDVIWKGTNNPILEYVFGATARGDGSIPGNGWFLGTVTYLKALDHQITAGVADSWSLDDEQYFFDVLFKRRMLVLLETNHTGDIVPIAWTLAFPPIGAPINMVATVIGDDIRLDWDDPDISRVAFHLIYRATEPDGFDFGNPIHNTSGDANPLGQNWLDIGAAGSSSPRDYYYVVRAVSTFELKSPTSLTTGKWTKHLLEGANSVSLPLKPLVERRISWYANDIPGVRTFDWIDESGEWVRYDVGNPNPTSDTIATMGTTFQLVMQQETYYTFIGRPGTQIWYSDRLGNSTLFQTSLTLEVQLNSVALSWANVEKASRYLIFRGTDRESVYDLARNPIVTTASNSYRDVNILDGFSGELYYTVIPEDDICGLGSSTFSRGVVKKTFHSGSQSFALELKPLQEHLVSWYTSVIDGVVGIAHMVKSYWRLHAWEMSQNVYDTFVALSEGYQILVEKETSSFVYVGY